MSGNVPKSSEAKDILEQSRRALKRSRVSLPILGEDFPVIDYFEIVKPILDLLMAVQFHDNIVAQTIRESRDNCEHLYSASTAVKAICVAIRAIEDVLIKYGRINHLIYFVKIQHGRNEHDQYAIEFVIRCERARERDVDKNGKPGPAYHCGQPFGFKGIEWVEWPGSSVGRPDIAKLPVYVQKHALERLYERALFIPDGEWLIHDYLWQSLRQPQLQRVSPGKYLVDYKLNVHKIGYFIARVYDDVVLIKTFLFLTMNTTPEGKKLWNKLKLGKKGKKHLNLDRIETFLQSDIQHDVELRDILEQCGCGHLFEILKEPPPINRCTPGTADEIRSYLQLEGN